MKAAVAGSGLSGLCTAALLVNEGYRVTVFEQYNKTGGITAGIEMTVIAGTTGRCSSMISVPDNMPYGYGKN